MLAGNKAKCFVEQPLFAGKMTVDTQLAFTNATLLVMFTICVSPRLLGLP